MEVVMRKTGYVYILTNEPKGELFIGVTSNLSVRTYQHKHNIAGSFTDQPYLKQLVYYEQCKSVADAITRKNELTDDQHLHRTKLIEQMNPQWRDLYPELKRKI